MNFYFSSSKIKVAIITPYKIRSFIESPVKISPTVSEISWTK